MSNVSKKFEDVLTGIAPVVIFVAAALMVGIIYQLKDTKYAVKETSAYTRVSNCIAAKVADPPTTQNDVEQCYTQVEKDSGIPLERFDMQTHNEKAEK